MRIRARTVLLRASVALFLAAVVSGCSLEAPTESPSAATPPQVLILLPAAGPIHGEGEAVAVSVQQIAEQAGFAVTQARLSEPIDESGLGEFRALVFVHGAAAHASIAVRRELLRFVEAGGGAVFVHTPVPPGNDWGTARRWLGLRRAEHDATRKRRLVGVAASGERDSDLTIDTGWHRFSDLFEGSEVVVRDEEGEPVAWRRRVGAGRIFTSDLGHDVASLASEFAVEHLETGIRWAAEGAPLDYSDTSPPVGSFSKQVLVTNVAEPIALALFPDRSGRLLFTERRGALKLYEPGVARALVVAELEVDTAGESGLLGLALDPRFEENGWLYLLATRKAEPGKPRRHRISRFTYDPTKQSLDLASEKPLLEIPLESFERGSSTHAGGALAISKTGDLFIATGDDTRIDASGGFAPIDTRPGRAAYDAARSAGNTDDLRGKVLRIRLDADGKVVAPPGNLFGEEGRYAGQGRPEIYAMGFRNPFTLARDPADGALYVGGPGPDAGRRDPVRGPAGVDEVNRIEAGNPGNFGWPFFAGDGLAYPVGGGNAGTVEDPRNDSPHNTGAKTLPAARPPLLAFGYATSRAHPELGKGPRSVWVGTALSRPSGQSGTRILLGDFMRQTLHWLDVGSDGQVERLERIAPEIDWNNPINGAVAADGTVYVLEYGAGWYSENFDAQLSRLIPSEASHPEARTKAASTPEAPARLSVEVASNRSFFGREPIRYRVDVAGESSGAAARVSVSLHEAASWDVLRSQRGSEVGSPDAGWSEHGCVSCHADASPATSIAPSRRDLGLRYTDADPQTVERLVEKIRIGGAGSFGERAMPPHPGLDRATRLRLVRWLLDAERGRELRRDLPRAGEFTLPVPPAPSSPMPRAAADERIFVLRAELDGERVERILRAPHFPAAAFTDSAGVERTAVSGFGGDGVVAHEEGAWLRYAALDPRGFSEVSLWLSGGADATGATLEVHFDAPDGPLLGEVSTLRFSDGGLTEVSLSLEASAHGDADYDLFVVFRRGRARADYVLLSIDFR